VMAPQLPMIVVMDEVCRDMPLVTWT
jgi:hypothetical protein